MSEGAQRSENVRERFRSHVTLEAKQVALAQLATGGPEAVSVNAIAKELGMSGPALYRYFDNRDALITELITDGYRDLTHELVRASAARSARPAAAVVTAYRAWAIEQPHRYRLLFAAPLAGYAAHTPDLVGHAQAAMNVLLDVIATTPAPAVPISAKLTKALSAWTTSRGAGTVAPRDALHAIHIWTRMHGHVRLEIDGTFDSMGLDPRLVFESSLPEIFTETKRTPSGGVSRP